MNFFEFTQNVFKFMFFRRMYHTTDARASMPFFSFIHDLISTDCLFEKKIAGSFRICWIRLITMLFSDPTASTQAMRNKIAIRTDNFYEKAIYCERERISTGRTRE